MHVLLVDSDPVIAKSIASFLHTQHIDCAVAYSAQQAIQLCDAKRPDAIVVDAALTGHSGIEFLHEFKSYHDWHTVPVIVWSMQYMTHAQKTALMQLGATDILYKPKTSLSQLAQKLQTLAVVTHE